MSLLKTGGTKVLTTQSGFLVQNGDAVTGSVLFLDPVCSAVTSVSGSATGSTFSLDENPVGTSINLSGTIGSSALSGNYTILSTGCSGPLSAPETGTFTASLVTPLTGNISGTFVSNTAAATTYMVTGQVAQGANTGSSSTPLTGSLTFTGGFCYPTANIVGSISGTAVVMNLVNSDGAQIGQVTGSWTEGTSFNGTYNYLGQTGAPKPCGDTGNGMVMLAIAGS
jgi:hypothetical protein